MKKIPCATCPDICETAKELYRASLLFEKIERIGIKCPKTGLSLKGGK